MVEPTYERFRPENNKLSKQEELQGGSCVTVRVQLVQKRNTV